MSLSCAFQPTLSGTLVKLRPLQEEDFEDLYEAACDPQIWAQHPEPTRYQKDVFWNFFESGIESQGALVVLDRHNSEMIGSSRYYDFKPDGKSVCIGYTFLKRSHWGGLYNQELKSLMLTHAFSIVDTVHFEVGPNNKRSRRALEKIGAVLIDTKMETTPNGNDRAFCVYQITKNSYLISGQKDGPTA